MAKTSAEKSISSTIEMVFDHIEHKSLYQDWKNPYCGKINIHSKHIIEIKFKFLVSGPKTAQFSILMLVFICNQHLFWFKVKL